jgi:hypothetical protein
MLGVENYRHLYGRKPDVGKQNSQSGAAGVATGISTDQGYIFSK